MVGVVTQLLGTAAETNVTATGTPVMIANDNPNRKQFLAQNQGSVPAYLATTSAVAVGAGYLLSPGATFPDSYTSGQWWVVTGGTSALIRCIEVS